MFKSTLRLTCFKALFVPFCLVGTTSLPLQPTPSDDDRAQPPNNIILFMTDDQDVTADSLDYMPRLNRLFRKEGMEFQNYYVPTGLCCPSRATIFRGQYCHNTKVYDNGDLSNATYQSGAWQKFIDSGLEEETFVTLLQSAGYETALIGKYLNGYDSDPNGSNHTPPGFDHWMGMWKLSFYGPTFCDNGKLLHLNQTYYQTDFIRDWAVDFLTKKRDPSKPFFLMMTPYAPHTPATPAKRHEGMFPDAKFPRHDSFNPSDDIQRHRPAWIKEFPPLKQDQIDHMDEFYRNRLRSLQAVDEALEILVNTLSELNLTDNTWFFYTADNGQHFGDFRIPAGKRQAYETDVLVPFLVRGPGIQQGSKSREVLQSVDLGPTFLDMATQHLQQEQNGSSSRAKLQTTYPMDGKSFVPLLADTTSRDYEMPLTTTPNTTRNEFRWAALLEMYGGSSGVNPMYKDLPGFYQNHMFPNTYQAVRIVNGPPEWGAKDADWLYVEWCTGEQEFYNMTDDPHQVHNLAVRPSADNNNRTATTASRVSLGLLRRLSTLLAKLGDCKGSDCYKLDSFIAQYNLHDHLTNTTTPSSKRRKLSMSLNSMQASIRNRIPCFNPPNMTAVDPTLGRKSWAADLFVPEPFTFGFPFSDADPVPEELLAVWRQYEHYFL